MAESIPGLLRQHDMVSKSKVIKEVTKALILAEIERKIDQLGAQVGLALEPASSSKQDSSKQDSSKDSKR